MRDYRGRIFLINKKFQNSMRQDNKMKLNGEGTSPFFLCQIQGGKEVEFLRFQIYDFIHLIARGMNLIRNMNHKRKYLLNRSKKYQGRSFLLI
uniref:hypothetical protein n=1 Tax=Drosera capensis TaxID=4366 RepID=UPI0024113382|nr:hypothetical protein P8577_pgp031 [Drosera capensis]WEQ03492.1 hypothetical protein [Drosera capensis]